QLQEELAATRRELRRVQGAQGREEAQRLVSDAQQVRGVPVVAAQVAAADERALREMGDAIRARLNSGVIVLAATLDGQARFIVAVDEALTKRGIQAGANARLVGERLGGEGGGRPDSAQGGRRGPGRPAARPARVPVLVR